MLRLGAGALESFSLGEGDVQLLGQRLGYIVAGDGQGADPETPRIDDEKIGMVGADVEDHRWPDAKPAIAGLLDNLTRSGAAVSTHRYETPDYDTERILNLRREIHPGELAQAVSKLLPDDAVVLGDAGAHVTWLGYYLELSAGQNFRKPGMYGPMAGHTNGALGVKCAAPNRTVVVGCGDGSYLMSGFELLTAVEYDIPVIWIIFNDGEFKLIKLYQLATYRESALVEFNNPDYVTYAEACGADGYRVETLEEFEDAFTAALASGKPTLIDAAITRFALPNFSSSPEGILAGLWERFSARFDAS